MVDALHVIGALDQPERFVRRPCGVMKPQGFRIRNEPVIFPVDEQQPRALHFVHVIDGTMASDVHSAPDPSPETTERPCDRTEWPHWPQHRGARHAFDAGKCGVEDDPFKNSVLRRGMDDCGATHRVTNCVHGAIGMVLPDPVVCGFDVAGFAEPKRARVPFAVSVRSEIENERVVSKVVREHSRWQKVLLVGVQPVSDEHDWRFGIGCPDEPCREAKAIGVDGDIGIRQPKVARRTGGGDALGMKLERGQQERKDGKDEDHRVNSVPHDPTRHTGAANHPAKSRPQAGLEENKSHHNSRKRRTVERQVAERVTPTESRRHDPPAGGGNRDGDDGIDRQANQKA
jgi:hypothetical protein